MLSFREGAGGMWVIDNSRLPISQVVFFLNINLSYWLKIRGDVNQAREISGLARFSLPVLLDGMSIWILFSLRSMEFFIFMWFVGDRGREMLAIPTAKLENDWDFQPKPLVLAGWLPHLT